MNGSTCDVVKPLDGANVAETISVNHRLVAEQRQRTGWRTVTFLNHPNFGWGVRAEDMIRQRNSALRSIQRPPPASQLWRRYSRRLRAQWDVIGPARQAPAASRVQSATDAPRLPRVRTRQSQSRARLGHGAATSVPRRRAFLGLGDFYSSTGSLCRRAPDGDTVTLAIKPEQGVKYHTQFIATMRDAPWESEPRTDADGKTLAVTRKYSTEIGKVIAESDGLAPSYRITGKELYVRAKVISSKPHPNPFQKGDVEVAWTQPVIP